MKDMAGIEIEIEIGVEEAVAVAVVEVETEEVEAEAGAEAVIVEDMEINMRITTVLNVLDFLVIDMIEVVLDHPGKVEIMSKER